MSGITTHVLDTTTGRPGSGISVQLERQADDSGWQDVGSGITDADGRVKNFFGEARLFEPGSYRLTFETGEYFRSTGIESFFPRIAITFAVGDAEQHYHVPLLLSRFGYTTYRGS